MDGAISPGPAEAARPLSLVSRGKPARLSSIAPGSGPAGAAVNGAPTGGAAFSTQPEANPFWEIDLEIPHRIASIAVWCREDAGRAGAMRARPLRVLLSRDGACWVQAAVVDYVFGGLQSGRPLRLEPAAPLVARFVRLQRAARGRLELDHVEIHADPAPPPHPYVSLRDLAVENGQQTATLTLTHDAGFFSNCSTILQGILDMQELGIATRRIDAKGSFRFYRVAGGEADIFASCFSMDDSVTLPEAAKVIPDADRPFRASFANHMEYRRLRFAEIAPFLRRYFAPSSQAAEIAADLMQRYQVDPSRTVGLCYRGTDKAKEIAPAPVEDYIAQAERLLALDGNLRLLVQTDQQQVRDRLLAHFGARAFCFREMPVTAGDIAVHHVLKQPALRPERRLLARRLVAAIRILAGCRYLITHSGNVGLWLALLRGSAEGLWQFNGRQVLVPPPDEGLVA